MKKTKIILVSILFLGGSFLAARAESGQAGPTPTYPPKNNNQSNVIQVSISESKIISEEDGKIKFSFKVSNLYNFEPGIRYAVALYDKTRNRVDQKIYPEIESIGANTTIEKQFEYQASNFLKGEYTVRVFVLNSRGFLLSFSNIGNVSLKGTGNSIDVISNSCFLKIEGDEKEYDLGFGADIKTSENLTGICKIKNSFSSSLEITPVFFLYQRNSFGKFLFSEEKEKMNLDAGEERVVEFKIPKNDIPQAYDAVLYFQNQQKENISNETIFHYVIQGQSATIQSLRLDKGSYEKGDNAKLYIAWVPSASNFIGSRSGEQDRIKEAFLQITMKDSVTGKDCINPINEKIVEGNFTIQKEASILERCQNPNISAEIKNTEGRSLDREDLSIKSYINASGSDLDEKSEMENGIKNTIYLAGGIGTLMMILVIIYVRIKKKKSNELMYSLVFIFFCFSLLSFIPSKAKAVSFTASGYTTSGGHYSIAYYNGSVSVSSGGEIADGSNPSIKYPFVWQGGTLTATGEGSDGYCENTCGWLGLWVGQYDGSGNGIGSASLFSQGGCGGRHHSDYAANSATFSANNTGWYYFRFWGTCATCEQGEGYGDAWYAVLSCNCSASANYCGPYASTDAQGYGKPCTCSGTKQDSCNCSDSASHCPGTTWSSTTACSGIPCTCSSGNMMSVNAECSNIEVLSERPDPNSVSLCKNGIFGTNVTFSGDEWCWTCPGVCSGTSQNCCARRDTNWKEVIP